MKTLFKPSDTSNRIEAVDALRGFALLGVLFANIPFGGNPPIESAYDEGIHFLYNFLISKKFISIFSMLFGFGFFIQFSRAKEKVINFNSYFFKRMGLLFLIGCIHSFVLWNGDIVMSYAFGGLFLLLLRNWSVKKLTILAILFNVILTGATFIGNTALGWAVYDYDFAINTELALTNSYWEYLRMNWITSPWVNFLNDMPLTLFFTFGNMLIGLILGKIGFFNSGEKLKRLKRWFVILGVLLGIPASYCFHLLMTGRLDLDLPQLWVPFATIIGMLFQSLAYITMFVELFRVGVARKILSGFTYVGKTALSNYLSQSVFYLVVIYHCTNLFQLYGKLSEPETYLLATLLFILQSIASYFWLKTRRQGPIEFLWKRMSYSTIKTTNKMKTIYTVLVLILTIQFANGQNRIAEKVSFPSGNETIAGTLVKPNNGDHLPAVVFQQGSGPHSFDGYETKAWGPHGFYIEDVLLEQGYAVLYCNKRGLGKSTGNWKKNSFQGRADDAYAAVTYLKTLPFIDPNRIGISGHSQGGWIAQIVAAQHSNIAFVIALAGPTVSVKTQTGSNDSLRYMCEGYSGEKLIKKMKKDRKHKQLGYNVGKKFGLIGSARFWYLIANYDNDEVLKSIKCPTLFLFAEHDINVDPDQNIAHFNKVFDDNPPTNFTIEVMKSGQHGFYIVQDRCVDWATAEKQPFDPRFQESIRRWVKRLDSL